MDYIKDLERLDNYKEKLDKLYEQKLDALVNAFLSDLEVDTVQFYLIKDILSALKNHSAVTYKHSIDVAFMCYEIGSLYLNSKDNFYTLNKEQLRDLSIAGLVHDAGKLDIDSEILEKHDKLSDEEFEKMKIHATKSATHIQKFNNNIIYLAVHHHEKLDGSGYPDHLKGNEISFSNRILTIADITSALYQERPYKHAYKSDEILKILKVNISNHKIDNKIIGDMIKIFEKINKLKNHHEKKN